MRRGARGFQPWVCIPRLIWIFLALAAVNLPGPPVQAMERLRMSTTTSTENTGLLAVLLPPFEKAYGCKVDVIFLYRSSKPG